jgi:Concanavalin A-like lectin/glucanases superfamily/HYR domain/Metallo-peptidase family M12
MNTKLLLTAILALLIHTLALPVLSAAPATWVQTITNNNETITLRLTREDLRGAHFEFWSQNAAGGYDVVTTVAERSYIGTVDEYSGAISCGILQDNGIFRGAVYFDRGKAWNTLGMAVVGTRATNYDAGVFNNYQFPTEPTVGVNQAGTNMYRFDVAVDADHNFYTNAVSSMSNALEHIEYSFSCMRAVYMRDALLRPYLARVIVRSTLAHDPYTGLTQGDYLNALRSHWNTNQTTALRDLVYGVSPTKIGGGLAFIGAVGTPNGYSVNQSTSTGESDVVGRHEIGHNWNLPHFVGGSPEGTGIMGGNRPGRFSGCELHRLFNYRQDRLAAGGILDDLGTYTNVALAPYAALDVVDALLGSSVTIDILGNDFDANGQTLALVGFDALSPRFNVPVALSQGTGPGGRDQLIYGPATATGTDYFRYTITDSSGKTATGIVVIHDEAVALSVVETDADSYVDGATPHGLDQTLLLKRLDDNPSSPFNRTAWIHFNTSNLVLNGSAAALRLPVDPTTLSGAVSGKVIVWGVVEGAPGDKLGVDWTEAGITDDNVPVQIPFTEGSATTLIGQVDSAGPGEEIVISSIALMNFLRANTNGEVTFIVTRDVHNSNLLISSRENPLGGATLEIFPLLNADTYVRSGIHTNTTHGDETSVVVRNAGPSNDGTRESFLRFVYTDVSMPIVSAHLKLTPAAKDANAGNLRIRLLDDANEGWDEAGLTWNDKPAGSGAAILIPLTNFTVGVEHSIDVTALLNQAGNSNKIAGFHLDLTSSTLLSFYSREAGPELAPALDFTTAPMITCQTNLSTTNDLGQCSALVGFTNTVSGVPAPDVVCTLSNVVITSPHAFTVGTNLVVCTATNVAGTNSCTFAVTVHDTQAPLVGCPSNITRANDVEACSAVVSYTPTASDNCPGVTIACVPASGGTFPVGTTTVTCVATDAAGNTNACSFTITVQDTAPPVVICSTNLAFTLTAEMTTTNVSYAVLATDNCGVVSTNCAPPSGFAFPEGTHTVICVATDAGGNTNACSFTIAVTATSSNVPPTLLCQADLSVNNDAGQCSAVVGFTNTATGVPAPDVVCTLSNVVITSPHAFTVGTNLVVCTATNVAGTSSCMFTVIVRDAQVPVLSGMPSSATYQCLGDVPPLPVVTATDNCGPLPVAVVCTTNGTCPVVISCTWSATDSYANSVSATRTFTVRDTIPPVITCPGNLAVTAASGTTAATVTFAASATDNCAVTSTNCTPPSGSSFPVGTNTVLCTATDACTNSASCSFTITVAPAPVEDFGCVISHWKFDESSGNTALDSVNGNPGTLMNGPARVPGQIGSGALQFNGVNQYVNVPNSASLNVPQHFSISLWFRPSTTLNAASGRKDLFKKFLSYWVIMNYPANDGKLAFVLNSGGPIVKSTTTSWTAGQWYHVAATHDGMTMRLYVNGVLENSSVVGTSAQPGTYPVQIGGNTEQGYWFPGAIDDARLFCTNLAASSVLALFNGSTNPPPPNTPPVISDIASRTIGANSDTGPIPFTIGDAETPADNLTVSATSSNTVLVPNANFVFNGTGSNRTVRVFPAPTQTGMTLVTITVSDGSLTTNDTFLLTVTNAPPPPPGGTNQLISRWQFDEMTGNTALDLNGVNNGTLVNGPARVGPKVGTGALQFNGVNQYVNVPDSTSLDLTNRFTIAFWMRPSQLLNASSGRRDLVQKFLSYWVILNYPGSDGRLAFVLNSGTPIAKSTTTSWNAGQWYHVAATYDGATMRLYINGIMEGSTPSVFVPNNSTSPVQFGGNTTQNYWFPGALDDIRFYGNPLSAASILDVMNGLSPLLPPGGLVTSPTTMAITTQAENDLVVLNWTAQAGRSYRVEYKDSLAGSDWTELPGEITVTGTTARAEDTLGLSTQRFYRVVIEP